MAIRETAVFKCSAERLWRAVEEPEQQKQWMTGLLVNESTSPGGKGPGSTFRMVIQEGRRAAEYQGEVTAYEKPYRLAVRMWGGNFPKDMTMRVDYRLTDLGGETRLDYEAAVESPRMGLFMRFMMVVFRFFGRMQLRKFFRRLRTLVETPETGVA